jgi:hypothetical protein
MFLLALVCVGVFVSMCGYMCFQSLLVCVCCVRMGGGCFFWVLYDGNVAYGLYFLSAISVTRLVNLSLSIL